MSPTVTITPVRNSVVVNVAPTLAFEIFTGGIDTWWPKSHSMGGAPFKTSRIEPFEGGRWYAEREDGSELSIARVLVWEPGRRVVFRWEITAGWKRDAANPSELEVNFIADGSATRVELEHRDFDRVGQEAGEFRNDVERGWPVLLGIYRTEVIRQASWRIESNLWR
jgi:uncharacterized protein YndB with AHSA1/START domain